MIKTKLQDPQVLPQNVNERSKFIAESLIKFFDGLHTLPEELKDLTATLKEIQRTVNIYLDYFI